MTADSLVIYSPAPPTTRLHALNMELATILAPGDVTITPVALPDSINRIVNGDPAERWRHLPIVTTIDFLSAVRGGGPDWHAYDRKNGDLKLVCALYDVAFGVMVFDAAIRTPADLAGRRLGVPPRPSSVRLYTEALLEHGWGLTGVELIDLTPPQVPPAVDGGTIDATTWNIVTIEPGGDVPAVPALQAHAGARWLDIDAGTIDRINRANPFVVGGATLANGGRDARLLSFRQGLAAWDTTPDDVVTAILDALMAQGAGSSLYRRPDDLAFWAGIRKELFHPAARRLF